MFLFFFKGKKNSQRGGPEEKMKVREYTFLKRISSDRLLQQRKERTEAEWGGARLIGREEVLKMTERGILALQYQRVAAQVQ